MRLCVLLRSAKLRATDNNTLTIRTLLFSAPLSAQAVCNRYCSNKHTHTAVINNNKSTRMHGEFLRLLFLQAHWETEAQSTAAGMSSQRNQSDCVCLLLVSFQARGILTVAEEQSRTCGSQNGGVEDQPQCRGMWHSSLHSALSLSRSPSPPPSSFTQSPSPPRPLVRDGQTSPHRPRLVVSMSSTIPLPPGEQLHNRYCSNKHTHLASPKRMSSGQQKCIFTPQFQEILTPEMTIRLCVYLIKC
jgi:hypothetical protein